MSVEDLPPPIQAHLPQHAQTIYLGAFNNAWMEYAAHGPTLREEIAHRVAWVAVKREYNKPTTGGPLAKTDLKLIGDANGLTD